MRKHAFGVSDRVRLKPVCSATETGKNLKIVHSAKLAYMLSIEQITKVLIKMHKCSGLSVALTFACDKVRFFLVEAHIGKVW